mgnify:FL=1
MDNLLKEAIADAKAVRETALENAKIALEEAFTPRLQSMLSKKIQSEMEQEGAHEEDEDMEERMHDEDEDEMEEMRLKADDEDPSDKHSDDDMEERMKDEDEDDMEERMHDEDEDEMEERMHDEDEDDKKDEAMHDEDEDEVEERMKDEDDDEMDEDLDLDEILKELEEEAEEDEIDENDVSSNTGSGDNKLDKKAGDSTDIGKAGKAKHTESVDEAEESVEEAVVEGEEEVEEDIDLEEVLKALSEEDEDEKEKDESVEEISTLKSDLEEHRNVVKYLRSKLNEVNLLNAKLLFTNKLFRAFGLTNDQKMKVVETFDRAANLREVKLVYSTLAESFGTKVDKKEIKESKGSASKAVASTKSKKQEEILTEGGELRNRFKKLAGII